MGAARTAAKVVLCTGAGVLIGALIADAGDETGHRPEPAATSPAAVYYASCEAAVAAHAVPLRRGQPGYRRALDRDGNGVACDVP